MAAARAWARKIETDMHDGIFAAGSGRTLAEAIAEYSRQRLPELRDPDTVATHLGWWTRQLGHLRLRDLTQMVVADAIDILEAGPLPPKKAPKTDEPGAPPRYRSPATVNRYRNSLSAVLTWAGRRGWAPHNAARHVPARRESKGRERFLSDAERGRLLEACKESDSSALHPAITVLLSTGARLMEAMRLRWSDVDLGAGAIVLRDTKNGDSRRVPLASDAATVLEAWRDRDGVARLPTGLVFPATSDPAKPADLRRAWRTALKRARITDFKRHDLRHSAASALAAAGASLPVIGAVLGHRSVQTTKRYTHLVEGTLKEAVEKAARRSRVA
ncbi:tyrosine-type recombinase/integrase [Roseicella aerolata]|uniref:Site-specific integrase n=1 Tax=Roseicella aerolata TaxID=2883479 RepID=A0A9X1IAE9_9PROT|nr:site-specific integrase [Roseicella aerolata]MCB4821175.1 site-specific integrase [Roseicella aerolata]